MSQGNQYLTSLFGLEGKTALITGGTRGIGQTMTLALAQAGANIVLVQRSSATPNYATRDKVSALGRKAHVVECDLSSKAEVKGLCQKVTGAESEGGLGLTIDIVVNCGGIQRRTPAENFPDEDWEEVLQVNLSTVFTISRDFGKHMLSTRGGVSGEEVPSQASSADYGGRGRGKIINVASLLTYQGGLTVPAYAAAKHGVAGIVKAMSNEWASKGVNINSIAPGYIATDMNEALIANPVRSRQIMDRIPAQRWGAPADFEGAIVFLASRASDYVSGETVVVDGGWMAR